MVEGVFSDMSQHRLNEHPTSILYPEHRDPCKKTYNPETTLMKKSRIPAKQSLLAIPKKVPGLSVMISPWK